MMTEPTGYASLVERLDKGSGEDREVAARLWAMQDNRTIVGEQGSPWPGWRARSNVPPHDICMADTPPYLTSLDAALGFAEATGAMIEQIQWVPDGAIANSRDACGIGRDAPRAVLVATLKALAARTTTYD